LSNFCCLSHTPLTGQFLYNLLRSIRFCRISVPVFFLFLCSSFSTIAQQKTADSLLVLLKSLPHEDTAHLNLLGKISVALNAVDNNKASLYADSAIALAEKIGSKPGLAKALFNKGGNYLAKSDYKMGGVITNKALALYSDLKDNPGIIECYIQLGASCYGLSDFATEIDLAQKAYRLSAAISNKRLLMKSLGKLQGGYTMLSDYPKALNYCFEQLKIANELHDDYTSAGNMGNISVIYYYLKQYDNALVYAKKSLAIFERFGAKTWIAAALNNIGGMYLEKGDYKQAIAYNKKAYAINQLIGQNKGKANDLLDIGTAYGHLNDYQNALVSLREAAGLNERIGAKNNLALVLGILADVYMKAPAAVLAKNGIKPVHRLDSAIALQMRSVALAHESKVLGNESDQSLKLSRLYEKRGDLGQALSSYKTYTLLKDSVLNDKTKRNITRLEIQYQFDKKEAAINAANSKKQAIAAIEIKRQKSVRNILLISGALLLVAAFVGFILYKRRNTARELQKEAELKTEIAESKMTALRAQLNPHFIFNSLNSISDYIDRHDKATADTYLSKFARLMRLILENAEHDSISLKDDLYALELYMQLEALRLANKFSYKIIIDDDIDAAETLVPPMLLQPFVENSIWHGISGLQGDGEIVISIKKENDVLICTVADNGIGREKAKAAKNGFDNGHKKSLGIKVIEDRLAILNAEKAANKGIRFTDLEAGTSVTISLPHELLF
jgi:tetratricopeptide (TPR) repeat protein/two-component sensor histidine kinase